MLSTQKLATLCSLLSLILLVAADKNLNPCDGFDWESADSDFLNVECIKRADSETKIMSGCIEKQNGM